MVGTEGLQRPSSLEEVVLVIILGVVLLILGAILDIPILWTIGIILVVVGALLWILGSTGRAVGPRSHYW
ncbi:DUF6131 family protein [Nocardioides gansuensis]|uniref:DUF6131 family protein n=1 Tax=Nocardioides gansuensis TaxID=2138300 RepID=UPI0010576196|nr:DUF6131 family protein [Nocardioides gansuensis]